MSDNTFNHRRNGNGNKGLDLSEIKRRAEIRGVYAALGGRKLRGNRGQAFWRDGDGYNVSLDAQHGLWHDFVSGEGGDVIELVRTVRQCSFREAAEWLAKHTGVGPIGPTLRTTSAADWRSDLRAATWWRISAEVFAELALAQSPLTDPSRPDLTRLLTMVNMGDAALVAEFRWWREHLPQWTAAMIRAGQCSNARVQRRLALWLRSYLDETA